MASRLLGRKWPSRLGQKRKLPGGGSFPISSRSCFAERARSAARDPAPILVAKAAPSFSVSANEGGGGVLMNVPLSPMAPAIRSLDKGDAICALTDTEPADSP